jgi:hypothetical protein
MLPKNLIPYSHLLLILWCVFLSLPYVFIFLLPPALNRVQTTLFFLPTQCSFMSIESITTIFTDCIIFIVQMYFKDLF